jgi:hypothetical protein
LQGCHANMHVIVQVALAEHERSRIAVLTIAQDGLQEGGLEGLADVVDTELPRWLLPWVGKSARRLPEAQRIGKATQKYMVPDGGGRDLGSNKLGRSEWVRGLGHSVRRTRRRRYSEPRPRPRRTGHA